MTFSRSFSCILLAILLMNSDEIHSASSSGVISGKVFLITKGGDLKPARLAMVFLLEAHSDNHGEGSAAHIYWTAKLANMKASYRQLANPDDSISCPANLLVFGDSLKSALDWNEHDKKDLIEISSTDEEGAFRFPAVLPGEYLVLVRGHAGANEAYWEEKVIAETGKETPMRLSSPKAACLQ